MLRTASLRAGVALLVAVPLASLPVRAVPFGGIDTFDKAPLDPSVWRRGGGDSDGTEVEGGRLVFREHARNGLLVRRFYPLQSEGERPDLGNFRVAMRLGTVADQDSISLDGISLGLQSPDGTWQIQLQIGSSLRGGLWIVPKAPGSKPETSMERQRRHRPYSLPFIADTLELVRQGNVLEARLRSGDKTQNVGRYRGDIPPTAEVWLQRQNSGGIIERSPFPPRKDDSGSFGTPQAPLPLPPSLTRSEDDEIAIDELRIESLPASIAYSQVLARWETETAFRTGGGMVPLSPDKPAASIKIGSLQSKPAALTLKTWVEDNRRQVVWKRDVPISLAPRQEKTISLPLPADRPGYFVLYRQLVDKKGNVIELLESTSFEIKPAATAGAK